jgi:hypothetical protein
MNGSSAISHSPIRTPDWFALRVMSEEGAATALQTILKSLDPLEKQVFALRGMAMLLIEERSLYRWVIDEEVGDYFTSFDRWMKVTLPNSWGYCRDALRAVKELKDVPFEDLLQIRRCNLEQLKRVSSNVRLLPEVVKAAKHLPEREFVSKLNKDHAQCLEVKAPVLMVPKPDLEEREAAIEMAMICEDCETRIDAEKAIYVSYIQEHAVIYEHKKEKVG